MAHAPLQRMSAAAAGSGSDVGAAALTSPGSFMNNHSAHMDHDHDDIMGLGAAGDGVMAPPHAFKQQRPSDPAAASPGFGHGHGTLLHCFAPPGDGFDATAQHAHGWAGLGGSGGGFGSCPSPPGSPGLSDGLGSLGSGALAPADSVASHSSSELLGGTAAGSVLPRVGSGGPYGSAAHADCADSGGGRGGCDAPLAAAAGDGGHGSGGGSGGSIGMEHDGVHPGALPPLGVGSPRGSNSHSPGLSAPRAVGSGANSRAQQPPRSAAAAAAATAGGHMATRGGGSGGARAAVRAGAAGDGGHAGQVFRSSYRGVSYDKKKRKWRVQIKVAALGKSGEPDSAAFFCPFDCTVSIARFVSCLPCAAGIPPPVPPSPRPSSFPSLCIVLLILCFSCLSFPLLFPDCQVTPLTLCVSLSPSSYYNLLIARPLPSLPSCHHQA